MPEVTAVVVNYNSGSDCARLLAELGQQRGVQLDVVVIDSASQDDSLHRARETAEGIGPRVCFIEPGRNVGYTGNNLGLRVGAGDAFVVNPDVHIADPGLLAALQRTLTEHPRLAAVAPCIDTAGALEYCDSVVDIRRAVAHHVPPADGRWPHLSGLHVLPWVNGAAWLLRGRALNEVGPLDERFFLFCEELDWCLRAKSAGWDVALSRDLRVTHHRSSSFTGNKGAYYYWRNLWLLCEKHPEPGWRGGYHGRLLREGLHPRGWASGASRRAWQGFLAARGGQYGPAPEDR